jgi:hypothetical protein
MSYTHRERVPRDTVLLDKPRMYDVRSGTMVI